MADADAAVALVHARGTADTVLLIRRAERDSDAWSGHWSFPGGRREIADGGLLDTALRELEEECGIRLSRKRLVKVLTPAVARRRVGRYLVVLPFLFQVDEEHPARLNPQEAVESLWVPLRDLRDPARHVLRSVSGLPPEARYPAIDLKGVPLWGFTYRLIVDWLDLNPPIERAGFETARAILAALETHGCTVRENWRDRNGASVIAVAGEMPNVSALEQAALPGDHIPWLNMLEVRSDRIRVVGLAFEEYLIELAR